MRVDIGADHGGFALKEAVKSHLLAAGHEVVDVGTSSEDSVDYPDYAVAVARAVARGEAEFGVLVCGTGLGMAIAANKVPGVRAVPVTDPEFARLAREHNDANVIALSGRFSETDKALEVLDTFLNTPFDGGGRHSRRIEKIADIEGADVSAEKE